MENPPNKGSPLKNSKQPLQWKIEDRAFNVVYGLQPRLQFPAQALSHMHFHCTNSKPAKDKIPPHMLTDVTSKETVQRQMARFVLHQIQSNQRLSSIFGESW